jgi:hypothetical protein
MKDSPESLELLLNRVDELERRVHALEHPGEAKAGAIESRTTQAIEASSDGASDLETSNIFPIIGRAMLGIAGAYVLRAVAAAGVLPKLPVSALAVAYAFGWLVWSSRVSRGLARVVYAGTSALILAPMLWEITLQFRVFTPMASAGVLAAFVTLATVLDMRGNAARSMWIAQSVAVITAAALALATHHILPFLVALLNAALVSEYARMRDYAQSVWPLIALVADAAAWGMIFIYSGPQNARAEYPELGAAALIVPACLLFTINGTALAVRAIIHGNRISVFDAIQTMIAFLLAVAGVLYFAPQQGTVVLGGFCLILSASMYVGSFRYLRQLEERRNFRVFSLWSVALLLAGLVWALPRPGAAIMLAIAAVAATWLAARVEPGTLELHGALFLIGATVVSRLPQYIFDVVAGSSPRRVDASILSVSVCAGVAFLVESKTANELWQRKALRIVPALVATCALIALLVHGVLAAAALALALDVHHVAFLRTLTICLTALCMAFGGSRWGLPELTRLAYVALAFVAAKLLFEDLRHGHMEFIAGSISLFAIALIAVPRLVRLGAKSRATVPTGTAVHTSL